MTVITKRAGGFTETAIDDEIVVMHLGTGEFFSLAGTATAIWRLIDGSRDRDALIDALSKEFGGDRREIAADVDEFLMQLSDLGLLCND